jgi:hypothetical protein
VDSGGVASASEHVEHGVDERDAGAAVSAFGELEGHAVPADRSDPVGERAVLGSVGLLDDLAGEADCRRDERRGGVRPVFDGDGPCAGVSSVSRS